MPSNHIYDIVEDNKGFLWLATDNGVSRFDGKYFQNFSIKEGLPSNDALQFTKEKDGTIWVNCFKQLPSYFDERTNKFITIKNIKKLDQISKTLLRATISYNEDLIFYNGFGAVGFKNKKLIEGDVTPYRIIINGKSCDINFNFIKKNKLNFVEIQAIQKGHKQDTILLKTSAKVSTYLIDENKLYVFNEHKSIYRITVKNLNPFIYKIDSVSVEEGNFILKFANQSLNVIGKTGLISILDKSTLNLKFVVKTDRSTNCTYLDYTGRLWVGTLDKGLQLYNKNNLKSIQPSEQLINNNFLSIGVKNDIILAGNYYGEILKIEKQKFNKIDISNSGRTTWLRKLVYTKKGFLAVHDLGYSLNFKSNNLILRNNGFRAYAKNALSLNDSIVIFNTNTDVIKLNINNLKTKILSENAGITPALAKIDDYNFLFVGANGLCKYSTKTNVATLIGLPKKWANEKVNTLAYVADGTLWINTKSGKFLVLKNHKIIATILPVTGLPENINCILAHQKRIWVGSRTGIYVIDYKYSNNKFSYVIKNISKTDGLPSNTINDFDAAKDIIYAATEQGVAIIPANYQNQNFEIKLQLMEVKINQLVVPFANNYTLKSDENNIALKFAGIELGGHFKNLHYAVNNKTNWNNLAGNILNIQLNSGENAIYVRAVDVNNQISKTNIKLSFFIETPFYKTIWFWALLAIFITTLFFWIYNRNKLTKQRIVFQQQLALAQQRNKLMADLHDDIGASLSSLQLNSSIANQLINIDTKQTQKILDKIESQSKNLADKIGDIIWSMKPGKEEFMTIGSRIKTFANDILGATTINYNIKVDAVLNTMVLAITVRKNIVFIAKEAINNCAKYSKAAQLDLSLKLLDKKIILEIADNGIGFENQNKLGNGLTNMRKRTEELNGVFTLVSSLNDGTTVSAVIPLVP